ncbi:MAG: hypothetical protein ACI8S6_006042 [Myxococcota bacterium]|jgi:hypothetical protein
MGPREKQSAPSLHREVERLRARRDRVTDRTLRRLRSNGSDDRKLAYAQGMGAMVAINRLSTIPVRDQVHPAMQDLIYDLFTDIGRFIHTLSGMFSEAAQVQPEPAVLARTLEEIRVGLEHDALSDASRTLHRNGLALLKEEFAEEGLQPRLRREARRLRQLTDLAERIALADGDTGVLTPANPALLAEVEAGEEAWSGESITRKKATKWQILGLIGCGLGIAVGGFMIVGGISCAISCGGGETLLIALLGGGIIFGSIFGIRAIQRARKIEPSMETELEEEVEMLLPDL